MAKKRSITDYRKTEPPVNTPPPPPAPVELGYDENIKQLDATGKRSAPILAGAGYPSEMIPELMQAKDGTMQQAMMRQYQSQQWKAGAYPWANADGTLKKGWAIGKDGKPYPVDEFGRPIRRPLPPVGF